MAGCFWTSLLHERTPPLATPYYRGLVELQSRTFRILFTYYIVSLAAYLCYMLHLAQLCNVSNSLGVDGTSVGEQKGGLLQDFATP